MSDFLRVLISLSLSGGALTVLVALLNWALKEKMPRTFLYYMWLLVLVRFLLPVGMNWSLTNRLVSPHQVIWEETNVIPAVNAANDIPPESELDVPVIPQPQTGDGDYIPVKPIKKETASWTPSLPFLLTIVWVLGFLGCILWKLYGYYRLRRNLWQNMKPVQHWERKVLLEQTQGMRMRPMLRRSHGAVSPMLVGLIRPVIWLPEKAMDAADLSYALRHELTHFRRYDLWLKWAANLTACLHWFNPAVWYLIHAMDRDCELSCDEMVVKGLSYKERTDYGELLLQCAVGESSMSSFFAPFGNQKKLMKERLHVIVRKNVDRKRAKVLLAASVAVIVFFGIVLGAYTIQAKTDSPDSGIVSSDDSVRNEKEDELVSGAGSEDTEDSGILTTEVIEALAAKQGDLTIEDFAPYFDLTPLEEGGSLWDTLEFTYNGEPMYLRLSASNKDLALAPYEGALDGAVIFHKEYLDLETLDQEYAYQGSCADIRSGDIMHILNGTVRMEDYMTVSLPEENVGEEPWQQGVAQSDFKYWMGSHGGVVFYKYGFTEEFILDNLSVENAGIYAPNPLSGGIEIWGVGELNQGTEVIRELEPLSLGDVVLRRKLVRTDGGTRWYVAYTDKPGSTISYCLYLKEDEFTEEEFLKISATIQLKENAIY